MDTNTQLLHTIMTKLDNIDTRMCAIEAQGERHSFVQPKATAKPVKPVKAVKTAKTAPKVQSVESKAHHAMKADLKEQSKALQKAFTVAWMTLRQEAGYGKKGNIPSPVYFKLQMQAWSEVA